jgi:hypothetical protein
MDFMGVLPDLALFCARLAKIAKSVNQENNPVMVQFDILRG